ncbi:hypothetical protein G7B40_037895 [Aetokthonos hydrillicola Thurmond2011]|jgi:hypothetical protein|uniref:Uncharacterized protein n=1 Tax=Aetokthonos hydrillicola Thurmond2011 TaxID=2712845 RepID=A0AAP5IGX8_9CYAN|nr:hypothetical protein [Aetokthonos hydrillicola]MBO3463857.1 hypothetical protein [Aetokthonos hydrillicola CCALA 1050]MBW4589787.1 hypothetical protein [Aetokthonos hydrillicola CCALA 1050]MDR9900282.1 hypothetical protein [Aetokthonos hydrillicola Thurmond2011]
MKRNKPYEVQQGEGGLFVPAGDEPIDSPAVALRMTKSMYDKVVAIAGKEKASWIREAIAEKLERDAQSITATSRWSAGEG